MFPPVSPPQFPTHSLCHLCLLSSYWDLNLIKNHNNLSYSFFFFFCHSVLFCLVLSQILISLCLLVAFCVYLSYRTSAYEGMRALNKCVFVLFWGEMMRKLTSILSSSHIVHLQWVHVETVQPRQTTGHTGACVQKLKLIWFLKLPYL